MRDYDQGYERLPGSLRPAETCCGIGERAWNIWFYQDDFDDTDGLEFDPAYTRHRHLTDCQPNTDADPR
jgi:hypothetical protein